MNQSSPALNIQANLQELFKSESSPGKPYLRFELNNELTALLNMQKVQESLIVSAEQITPLPNMPEAVIGMMNSRDRVFCIFDLAQLLTLPSPFSSPREYQLIVIDGSALGNQESQALPIGFAVSHLLGITRLESESFPMPQGIQENMKPFVLGSPQDCEQPFIVLDDVAISKAASMDISSK